MQKNSLFEQQKTEFDLYTSNYSSVSGITNGNDEIVPIGISCSTPRWYGRGRTFKKVAPTRQMLDRLMDDTDDYDAGDFLEHYLSILYELDAEDILKELFAISDQSPIVLLCWCARDAEFCHRRYFAEWLEEHIEIVVPEWGEEREETFTHLTWNE